MKNLFIAIVFLSAASCATTVKFPISSVAPAADISAVKNTDKHNNYTISVTAKNLASVDRIAPSKTTYVVWVSTLNEGIKDVGQLNIKNAKTSSLKTLTSFDFDEVIITAEEQGDIIYPSGIEISRVKVK